jgi:hypothetical protein
MSIEVKIEGGKLIITCDIQNPMPESKSGKGLVLASTYGIMKSGTPHAGGNVELNMTAYIPKKVAS